MTRFVDVHVHPPRSLTVASGFGPYLPHGGTGSGPETVEELADHYRQRGGIALVHAFDAGSVVGSVALSNARLAAAIEPHSDVLHGLGCVDPHRGEAAVMAIHDALRLGLRGLFFHPPAQRFDPASRRVASMWKMAEDLRFPVVVHCGTTMMGAGRPGGAGISLEVADPMRIDRVAATHPDLQIVMAGVTPPWEEAAIAVAAHKGNVHLALSGRRPDRMGAGAREAVLGPLASRAMCATGYPLGDPDDWLAGWAGLSPPGDVDAAVRHGNAESLFGV